MSGDATKPIVCWDSCGYIGYFTRNEGYPLHQMQLVLEAVRDGDAIMLVTAINVAEVLDVHGGEAARCFREFIRRPNIRRVDIDFRIAERAAAFRERTGRHNNLPSLETADALILAAASIYEARVQTLEGDLIRLSGHDAVNCLHIERFRSLSGQGSLWSEQERGEEAPRPDRDPLTGAPFRHFDLD